MVFHINFRPLYCLSASAWFSFWHHVNRLKLVNKLRENMWAIANTLTLRKTLRNVWLVWKYCSYYKPLSITLGSEEEVVAGALYTARAWEPPTLPPPSHTGGGQPGIWCILITVINLVTGRNVYIWVGKWIPRVEILWLNWNIDISSNISTQIYMKVANNVLEKTLQWFW